MGKNNSVISSAETNHKLYYLNSWYQKINGRNSIILYVQAIYSNLMVKQLSKKAHRAIYGIWYCMHVFNDARHWLLAMVYKPGVRLAFGAHLVS